VLLAFLAGTGALLWFSATIFLGAVRHKGHFYIFMIACFWLLLASRGPELFESQLPSLHRYLRRYQVVFLTTILFVQLVGGTFAMWSELRNTFSETRHTAEFVRDRITPSTVLAGTSFMVGPMTAYLDVKCYMVDRQTFGTFMIWDNKTHGYSEDENEKLQVIARLLNGATTEVLFVSEQRLDQRPTGLEVTELAEFKRSLNSDQFYVYRLRRNEQSTQGQLSKVAPYLTPLP
jgi:hypothetical protein